MRKSQEPKRYFPREEYERAVAAIKNLVRKESQIICITINAPRHGGRDYVVLALVDGVVLNLTELLAETKSFELVTSSMRCSCVRVQTGGAEEITRFLSLLCFDEEGHVTFREIGPERG